MPPKAKAIDDRPSLIVARTHIGYGSPHKHDTFEAHVEPLSVEEVRLTKRALGWPDVHLHGPHLHSAISRRGATSVALDQLDIWSLSCVQALRLSLRLADLTAQSRVVRVREPARLGRRGRLARHIGVGLQR